MILNLIFCFVSAASAQTYEFASQFNATESSVGYSGQAHRQTALMELINTIESLSKETTPKSADQIFLQLWSYIEFRDSAPSLYDSVNAETYLQTTANLPFYEASFFEISRKKSILSKLAGNDNPLFHGEILGLDTESFLGGLDDKTPEAVIVKVIDRLSESLSQTAPTYFSDGLDLKSFLYHFILGALNFSQTARDYLSADLGAKKGINADNTAPAKEGKTYTALEHHWDEGFGYFGANRNYLETNALDCTNACGLDANQDGFLSLKSEVLFGHARLYKETNKAQEVFKDFMEGRKLIAKGEADVSDLAQKLIRKWEALLANSALKESMTVTISAEGSKESVTAWSKMKANLLSLQFNPTSLTDIEDFKLAHQMIGDSAPQKMTSSTLMNLSQVRKFIAENYR